MAKFEQIRHQPPTALSEPRPFILVLAPLRSNVNLSRIVRVAGCAAIPTIYQCGPGKVDPEIARDAKNSVNILRRNSVVSVLEQLGRQSIMRIGLEQTTNSQCLFSFAFPKRCALVIGNERQGLTQDILNLLDAVVEIPVYGQPLSYNVATATTMAIYEYCRQYPNG